jgi:UDP-N-acetylglucosamine acyltransferase
VIGNRAELGGLNLVGLKRRGFGRDVIHALRGAYRTIFEDEGSLAEGAARAGEAYPGVEPVQRVVAFIQAGGSRNFCTPRDG